MRNTFVSLLAVASVLSFAVAPASAHSHRGFGLGSVVAGLAGAFIGAEIVSHAQPSYHERDCFTRYHSVYDEDGAYVGRRVVSNCD